MVFLGRKKNPQKSGNKKNNVDNDKYERIVHLTMKTGFQDRKTGVLGVVVDGDLLSDRIAIHNSLPGILNCQVNSVEGKAGAVKTRSADTVIVFYHSGIALHPFEGTDLHARGRDYAFGLRP